MRVSIANAAQATGVDFDYLLAQARLESGLNPQARAGTSSAAGLYQFLGSTWLNTVDQHGERYGLGWASAAISGGQVVDPALNKQIMALRHDPDAASLMAAELAKDNQAALRETLGREPDFSELYMAHFLGSDGASRFLTALQENPGQSAAALFPRPAAANRPVFFTEAGTPRSLGEVMDFFRSKMANAVAQGGGAMPVGAFAGGHSRNFGQSLTASAIGQTAAPLGPLAREFSQMATLHAPSRTSMVETLRDTFASSSGHTATLPDNVRAAYNKLKAAGL